MSTLNAAEEVYLAEKLIELDPWAGMVGLRVQGAKRMRCRTYRKSSVRVAVCGYHGWHVGIYPLTETIISGSLPPV